MRRALLTLLLGLALLLAPAGGPADAQDGPSQVPTQDIIPEPDSGEAPDEPGDRGGGLQLLVLGLVVLAVVGGGWHIVRQVRQGRTGSPAR